MDLRAVRAVLRRRLDMVFYRVPETKGQSLEQIRRREADRGRYRRRNATGAGHVITPPEEHGSPLVLQLKDPCGAAQELIGLACPGYCKSASHRDLLHGP